MAYLTLEEERGFFEGCGVEADTNCRPTSKADLVAKHIPLVRAVARTYVGRGVEREDLMQEGMLGLCRAVEDFDPGKARFSTHAKFRVVEAIQNAIYRNGTLIRVPVHASKTILKFQRLVRWFQDENGRRPTKEEAMSSFDLSSDEYDAIVAVLASRKTASFHSPREDGTRLDVADEDEADPSDIGCDGVVKLVRDGLHRIDPAERYFLVRRFGIDREEPESLAKIGRRLKLNPKESAEAYETAAASMKVAIAEIID